MIELVLAQSYYALLVDSEIVRQALDWRHVSPFHILTANVCLYLIKIF